MRYSVNKWICSTGTLCILAFTNVSAAPQDEGSWGPVVDWPTIAIHSVLTPQGKVMNFGTDENGRQGAQFFYDMWDPALGTGADSHTTLPNTLGVDSFCSAALLLPETGGVLMSGGDNRPNGGTNRGISDALVFNTQTNTLERASDMVSSRWYPTSTVLPSGEILLNGGRDIQNRPANTPEIYSPETNQWRSLLGVSIAGNSSTYPRQWVAPTGKIFGYFNANRMFTLDPAGNGSLQLLGNLPTSGSLWLSSGVMYQPGKILHVGGVNEHSNTTLVIDINGAAPAVRAVSKPTESGRVLNTSVVLPNGKVMVVGGSKVYNQLNGTSYRPEIWDPATEAWSQMASAVKARLYHSTALLLKDGRVLVAGGGAPGPQVNTNAEIFTPPYLYNSTGQLAARPTIVSAPEEAPYGSKIAVRHNPGDVISRVTLVKTGAVTHSNNMEQRFIELDFQDIHNGVSVTLPDSPNLATPGYYLLHLVDNKGVPSEATIVRISNTAELEIGPYPEANTDTGTSTLGATITLDVLANDIGNGKGLVQVNEYSEQGGTAQISNNKIVYTPKPGYGGTDTFWYVMEDDQGRTNSTKVTVTVTAGESDAYPVAVPDEVSATGAITIDVLANDTGNGRSLVEVNEYSEQGGTAQISNNKIIYTPKPGYDGNDVFWYVMKDNQDRTNSTKVTVAVTGGAVDVYPVAVPDEASATGTITIDVLENDTGNGRSLVEVNEYSEQGGTAQISNNKIIYTPRSGYNGNDVFWYVMKDDQGRTNSTKVTVAVTTDEVAPYPIATPDNYTTPRNTAMSLDVLANDTPTGAVTIDTIYAYTENGGTTTVSDGEVLYTPKADFTGEDNFWYVMVDSQGRTNSTQVIITVTP